MTPAVLKLKIGWWHLRPTNQMVKLLPGPSGHLLRAGKGLKAELCPSQPSSVSVAPQLVSWAGAPLASGTAAQWLGSLWRPEAAGNAKGQESLVLRASHLLAIGRKKKKRKETKSIVPLALVFFFFYVLLSGFSPHLLVVFFKRKYSEDTKNERKKTD